MLLPSRARSLLLSISALGALAEGCNCGRPGSSALHSNDGELSVPSTLSFGTVGIGQHVSLQLAATNSGGGELTLGAQAIASDASHSFSEPTLFAQTLSPGETSRAVIAFTPTKVGPLTAVLQLTDDGTPGSQTITLTGMGSDIGIVASPPAVSFAATEVGAMPPPTQSVIFTNNGASSAELTLDTSATASEFAVTDAHGPVSTANPQTLAPGATYSVQVAFEPDRDGAFSSAFAFTACDGARSCLSPQSIGLAGTGGSGLTLTPSPVSFSHVPMGGQAAQVVTVQNAGVGTVNVSCVYLQSAGNASCATGDATFGLSAFRAGGGTTAPTPAAPLALAAGASFTFTLTYTPSSSARGDGDVLDVDYAPLGSSVPSTATDLLSGNETAAACALVVSPTSVGFGTVTAQHLYARQISVTNLGLAPCTLTSIALDPTSDQAFNLPPATPGTASIPAGGSVNLEVDFELPSAVSPLSRRGTLTFQSNDPNFAHVSVPLSATLEAAYDAGWPTCVTSLTTAASPPKTPILPLTIPSDCRVGFEINDQAGLPAVVTLPSIAPQGSRANLALELDFATYAAPDSLQITAIDASGDGGLIFGPCYISTAAYGDPTDDAHRPPEDSVRDFRVPVPAGTVALTFAVDQSTAPSPWYARVDGLCDFNLSPPAGYTPPAYRAFDYRDCVPGTCEEMSLCGAVVQHCGQSYDCSAAASCDGGAVSAFQDPLSSLGPQWTTFGDGGTSVSVQGGQVAVTLPGAVVGVPAGIASVAHYDLQLGATSACTFVHVANPSTFAAAGEVEAWLALKDADDNELRLSLGSGALTGTLTDADGVITISPASIATPAGAAVELAICGSASELAFGDSVTSSFATVVAPGAPGSATEMGCSGECGSATSWLPVLQIEVGARRLHAGADATVLFENLNLAP